MRLHITSKFLILGSSNHPFASARCVSELIREAVPVRETISSANSVITGVCYLSANENLALFTALPMPLVVGEDALTQADVLGCYLNHLIFRDEVKGFF